VTLRVCEQFIDELIGVTPSLTVFGQAVRADPVFTVLRAALGIFTGGALVITTEWLFWGTHAVIPSELFAIQIWVTLFVIEPHLDEFIGVADLEAVHGVTRRALKLATAVLHTIDAVFTFITDPITTEGVLITCSVIVVVGLTIEVELAEVVTERRLKLVDSDTFAPTVFDLVALTIRTLFTVSSVVLIEVAVE